MTTVTPPAIVSVRVAAERALVRDWEVAMRSMMAWKLTALAGLLAIVACSAGSNDNLFSKGGKGGGGGNGGEDPDASSGGSGDTAGAPGYGGSGLNLDVQVNSETTPAGCQYKDGQDHDGDGYTGLDGDCNDCDPNTNPGAFDDGSPSADGGPPVDVNCDGTPGDDTYECDDGLQIADDDPFNAAKAIGLCRRVDDPNATGKDKRWGVIEAKYVLADGSPGMNPKSHGVLPQFGAANVQQGKVMLGLSSGTARGPAMAGYESPGGAQMGTQCGPPIPNMESPSCPNAQTGQSFDPAALEVRIRVPTNAKSFKFYLNFYTYEFPMFVCTTYNDFYITKMDPWPQGSTDGNISFDQDHNPISVNNSLLQACKPQNAGGKQFTCPLGVGLLQGTGFEGHAATGWLQTQAPVTPGSEITLRWAIWDSGDHVLDSTVLVDNFVFSVEPAQGGTTTTPVDNPH